MITLRQKSQKGATMIEYVLLAALLSIVAILAIQATGSQVKTKFETVSSSLATT